MNQLDLPPKADFPYPSLPFFCLPFYFFSLSSLFSPKLISHLSPSSSPLPLLIPSPLPPLSTPKLCFFCDIHFQRHLNQLKMYLLPVYQSQ